MNVLLKFTTLPSRQVLTGVDADNMAPLCFREIVNSDLPVILFVPQARMADRLANELFLWQKTEGKLWDITLIPEPSDTRKINPETEILRHRIAHQFLTQLPRVSITTPTAFLAPALYDQDTAQSAFMLRVGDRISPFELLEKLVALDYDDELEINIPGEFSHRGGIIDIFAPNAHYPVRVEFFGNTIDSLRLFSVLDQRKIETVKFYEITPKPLKSNTEGRDYLDCLGEQKCKVVIVHPDRCDHFFSLGGKPERYEVWDTFSQLHALHAPIQFWEGIAEDETGEMAQTSDVIPFMQDIIQSHAHVEEVTALVRERIAQTFAEYIAKGYQGVIGTKDLRHKKAIDNYLEEYHIQHLPIKVIQSQVPTGYVFEHERMVYLSEYEVFYTQHQRKIIPVSRSEPLPKIQNGALTETQFAELNEGDYAVHLVHGICRFTAIKPIALEGLEYETLELEFADEKFLYVPIYQIHLVSRYAGTGRGAPVLHKLTGKRWENTKTEALAAIKRLAADLLRLHAARTSIEKIPFPPETSDEYRFAAMFPYRETPDQMRAIIDTQNDMMSTQPMDRLVCGDVGYGKTEVAIRAIFKAVCAGKQVAVLAPTTILAQQHYFTLCERLAEYPYTVDVMSRFRSTAEIRDILARLKTGGIDIVVGTHRLIQDDVRFKDLGLIVVDEEQRFGVDHKEKLKRMRLSVDILTLSATPIPRTLYMSMTGLRDLSTLFTAPENRLPVETYVIQRDMPTVVDAIQKELQRGGQVFYLHNRVRTIAKVCDNLRQLLPDARIEFAHGQMEEGELEWTMSRFIEGELDILVCTTIIESGVDIPNANTLIIDDAHFFGLSELYQLRGRVGRANRQAYAYFLLPGLQSLTSDARKRMLAIQKYTQLGAGFKLAMRDLEIRGSGNLLGAEQSGHIAHIGFDLYCRMLRQTVSQFKGETIPIYPDAELGLLFLRLAYQVPDGLLAAAIPPDYVPALSQRITLYRRLANLSSEDAIEALGDELRDRFGPLPECVQNLLVATQIRLLASQRGFKSVRQQGECLLLEKASGRYWRDERDGFPVIRGKNLQEKLRCVLRILRSFNF